MKTQSMRAGQVYVWDRFVRVFHWTLLLLFTGAWLTGENDIGGRDLHEWLGYAIGALITLRILWGFIGSEHARFKHFIYRPSTVIAFLRDTVSLRARRYLGHNPAGGAMVIALLLGLIVSVLSGFLMTTDLFWGEEWVEELHEIAVHGMLVLAGLHVAGVVVASLEHRESLVKSMLTGFKRAE